jgi:hypothetical protein
MQVSGGADGEQVVIAPSQECRVEGETQKQRRGQTLQALAAVTMMKALPSRDPKVGAVVRHRVN